MFVAVPQTKGKPEANMDELKWDFLTEVQGRWQADLIKSYLEAGGIEAELFQESLGQSIIPTTLDILGNVQIYVPKAQLKAAQKALKEYYNPPEPEAEVEKRPVRKSRRKSLDSKSTSKTTKRKSQ